MNLKEDLDIETPRVDPSHQVKNVSTRNDISWGTPLQTPHGATKEDIAGKTPFRPAIHDHQTPHSSKRTPVPPPQIVEDQLKKTREEPKKKSEEKRAVKFGYLDREHRPMTSPSGEIPPDPLRQRINEAEQIGSFLHEFKELLLKDQFERIESERREEQKRREEVVETMLADAMSRGAISAQDQSVAPIDRNTGPLKNQCRRLHDTKINHAGSTTQVAMGHRTMFKARFITKSDKDSLRQLYGFIFGDGKIALYEYRHFGGKNYNRNVTPILERNYYSYQHGMRKGEQYVKRDIRPGVNLTFLLTSGNFPMKSAPRKFAVIRVTEVEEYKEQSADPWWGLPSGGPRTQQERVDREVVAGVQQIVKERLRDSMVSSLQSLQSHFKKLDKSGDGLLSKDELVGALNDADICLNEEQIDSVWRIVDEDQSGEVEYQEFIAVFVGEMSEDRIQFLRKCWRKLDPKGTGSANVFDVQKIFSAKHHPRVKAGEKSEQEVFEKFCRVLEAGPKTNEIEYNKFYEFFLALSLTIERDHVFINLLQVLFGG